MQGKPLRLEIFRVNCDVRSGVIFDRGRELCRSAHFRFASKADVRSLRKIGRDGLKGDQVLQYQNIAAWRPCLVKLRQPPSC